MSFLTILKIASYAIPIIAAAGIPIFGFLKKIRKLKESHKREVDYLDNRIDFYQKNRQAYQLVVDKLMEKKKNANALKEKINNSDSSDIADILNEL